MTSQLLELRIDALEKRIKAIEDALNIQSDTETPPGSAEDTNTAMDTNKTEARRQYDKQSEENKKIAECIPDETIKKCIEAAKGHFPFVYLQDVYRIYDQYCISENKTPIYQKYFLIAANRAGYPTYFYYGRTCIWISDKPKKKPGKRKKPAKK